MEGARRRCSWTLLTLRVNYRTSHQIRSQADRLLGPELSDVDGITEKRGGTISTFNGPPPETLVFDTAEDEIKAVCQWLVARTKEGIVPHEIGVFVRSAARIGQSPFSDEGCCASIQSAGRKRRDDRWLCFYQLYASGEGPGVPYGSCDGL